MKNGKWEQELPFNFNGKIRNYDVQDYGFIVEYFIRSGFGPYWMDKDNLPSLLDNDIPLIVPMDDDD